MRKNYCYVSVWSHANLDYHGYISSGLILTENAHELKVFDSFEDAHEGVELLKRKYEKHLDVLEFEIHSL